MNYGELLKMAIENRKTSYSPYSKFRVGAALLAKNGRVFGGGNIENSSFGATNCAERTAIFKAVSEGEREFEAIAIAGGYDENLQFCPPCGICRQVMAEFADPKTFKIVLGTSENDYKVYTLAEILPLCFSKSDLG